MKTIAIIYDFDKTLSPKNMQEYGLFDYLNTTAEDFWHEANSLAKSENMDSNLAFMYCLLDRAKREKIKLTRKKINAFGKKIEFFDGVIGWFKNINEFAKKYDLTVEHYIISSGLKEIIEGSKIAKEFTRIFATEFYYQNDIPKWPKIVVNYTAKTQFLFRINKQALDLSDEVKINKFMPECERPISFEDIIYIGDGFTDVPCMRLVKSNGGHSIAVHQDGDSKKLSDILVDDQRVDFVALSDYTNNSQLNKIVKAIIKIIALKEVKN